MAMNGYIRDLSLYAICAGACEDVSGGKVDPVLKSVYTIVLPICDTCKRNCAETVVGHYTHNGKASQQRIDKNNRVKAVDAANE